jgi:hypothetical protein
MMRTTLAAEEAMDIPGTAGVCSTGLLCSILYKLTSYKS